MIAYVSSPMAREHMIRAVDGLRLKLGFGGYSALVANVWNFNSSSRSSSNNSSSYVKCRPT